MWGGLILYFVVKNRFADLIGAIFNYNRYYISIKGSTLSNVIGSFSGDALRKLRDQGLLCVLLPLAVVSGVGFLLDFSRKPPKWMLLLAYGLGVQIAIGMQGFLYEHYFQLWLPPLVVGAGWAVARLARTRRMVASRFSQAAGVVTLIVLIGV